jgi:Predicted metal binding domain
VNLVNPDVSARKIRRELELWDAHAEAYSRRGWIMLRREPPVLDIAFLARLPVGGNIVPAVAACVQIDFTNFDLWAPSVEFIDPISRDYAPPVVQALVEVEGGAQNLIVGGHPDTGRPFLCIPGVRQYHSHPQHAGDPWLLHRSTRGGSLTVICDRIWQTMARTLLGVQIQMVTLPGSLQLNIQLVNAPGEQAPAIWAQAEQQPAPQAARADGAAVMAALGLAARNRPADAQEGEG